MSFSFHSVYDRKVITKRRFLFEYFRKIIGVIGIAIAIVLLSSLIFDYMDSVYLDYLRTSLFGFIAINGYLDFFLEQEEKRSYLITAIVSTFVFFVDVLT